MGYTSWEYLAVFVWSTIQQFKFSKNNNSVLQKFWSLLRWFTILRGRCTQILILFKIYFTKKTMRNSFLVHFLGCSKMDLELKFKIILPISHYRNISTKFWKSKACPSIYCSGSVPLKFKENCVYFNSLRLFFLDFNLE